jgi:hypothetical protein
MTYFFTFKLIEYPSKILFIFKANDVAFEKFVQGKKFKQCPKCQFWVEKNMGCDHMVCRCNFEFCYKCGGIYKKCKCVEKIRGKIIFFSFSQKLICSF